MVIRRIREHVAAHNWFAVGIDLAIVVVGVLIATQVGNWNEARSERAQAIEDRQRLIADLGSNTADFDNRLNYFRAVRGHAQATLDEPGIVRELTRYLASTDERLTLLDDNLQLTNEIRGKLVVAARRD